MPPAPQRPSTPFTSEARCKRGSSAMASLWLPVLPVLVSPARPVPRAPRVATRSVAFTFVSCALAWKAWNARQARQKLRAALSTGNLPLDLLLEGGLPHGLVEIYGPPQHGKTSLALSCVEAAVKQGRRCAVLDVDRSWPGASSCLAGPQLLQSFAYVEVIWWNGLSQSMRSRRRR